MSNKENIILSKSYDFAVQVIQIYKSLTVDSKEFILSKQLLRSGTSIGANVEEANGGYSKRDFRHKMSIGYKEARETMYWLKLLKDTSYLEPKSADKLIQECDEILKILWSILKTTKPITN